jgi:hypothetical protein
MKNCAFFHARVCTADHRQFANLPRYAAKVLVEIPAHKFDQTTPIVLALASKCVEQRFHFNSVVRRTTEVDQIVPFGTGEERNEPCDYQDENGRAWIIRVLSGEPHQPHILQRIV